MPKCLRTMTEWATHLQSTSYNETINSFQEASCYPIKLTPCAVSQCYKYFILPGPLLYDIVDQLRSAAGNKTSKKIYFYSGVNENNLNILLQFFHLLSRGNTHSIFAFFSMTLPCMQLCLAWVCLVVRASTMQLLWWLNCTRSKEDSKCKCSWRMRYQASLTWNPKKFKVCKFCRFSRALFGSMHFFFCCMNSCLNY